MSLLDKLAAIDKETGLTEAHDRGEVGKIGYVETQISEIKTILWRLRCDTLLNVAIEAETEEEKAAQEAKAREFKRDIKRMVQAVNVYNELLVELKK